MARQQKTLECPSLNWLMLPTSLRPFLPIQPLMFLFFVFSFPPCVCLSVSLPSRNTGSGLDYGNVLHIQRALEPCLQQFGRNKHPDCRFAGFFLLALGEGGHQEKSFPLKLTLWTELIAQQRTHYQILPTHTHTPLYTLINTQYRVIYVPACSHMFSLGTCGTRGPTFTLIKIYCTVILSRG